MDERWARASVGEVERRTLRRLVALLEKELGERLRSVWLFGSRSRGEPPGEDSDVDLIVVTDAGRRDFNLVQDLVVEAAEAEGFPFLGPCGAPPRPGAGRLPALDRRRLVNRVVEPERLLDEALAYARDVAANCSPTSMAIMKRQVYAALHQGLDEALAEADRLMLESFGRDDFREGVLSFVERRAPAFPPYRR